MPPRAYITNTFGKGEDMMGIAEAVRQVNEAAGGALNFLKGREKGDFEALLGRELTLDNVAITESKFYDNENALFTVKGDRQHYYRACSGPVVEAIKKLQDGLDEDGLDWDTLVVVFEQVRSKQGRRYYTVRARLVGETEPEAVDF
jgi:hypothetical protein